MKIGLVCPYDLTRSGGVQEHVLAQAIALRRRGHTVKIITPKPRRLSGPLPPDTVFVGNSRKVKAAKTSLELAISVTRDAVDDLLTTEKFDLLHIHEPEVPVLGAQIVAKATCPVVATFHALYPPTAMGRTLETIRIPRFKSIITHLDALTVVSEAAAHFIREQTDRSLVIVPNGIDLAKYQLPRRPSKAPTILYIGRLEKRKGVRYLLKAFALIQAAQPDYQLIIAGDGELHSGLVAYVKDNAIANVTFKGFVTEAEKLELLAQADVFCSPALYGESFGIVLLEAMAAGVPIVAGDNPGYSTVLVDQARLSLINPRDTQDFARRLDVFLQEPSVRQLWLEWSRDQIGRYSYDKIVDQYEQLYQKVLNDK